MKQQITIGNREFATTGHTYVMGILNVTPDSFSDGGSYICCDDALRKAEQMIADGADIVDIGGESTRPGHDKITAEEEIARVVPVITAIKEGFDIPVSLDTYKANVAAAGIEAGADLINDIWGLKYDSKMASVIKKAGISCCLMHNRQDVPYRNLIKDMKIDLQDSLNLALDSGIEREKIILDPGVGFAKTYEQNLRILARLSEFVELGYPILLGASRKSVIGLTLNTSVTERLAGTLVTSVFAAVQNCSFIRVHDVKENVQAIAMAEAILGAGGYDG